MLWFGHLALGYLVTKTILALTPAQFSMPEIRILMTLGMIAALLPDIDLIPFFIKHRSAKLQKNESHRRIWSHAPLLWIAVLLLILSMTDSPFAFTACLVFLAGSLTHFLADSIEDGVFWLWPFSNIKWYLHKAKEIEFSSQKTSVVCYYKRLLTHIYIKNWTFWIESVIILLALVVICIS